MEQRAASSRPWFPGGERAAFFLLMVGTLYAAYRTARPVLLALVLAAAVASLSYPAYRQMVRLTRGRRRLSALATLAAVLIGGLGPLAGFSVVVGEKLVAEISQVAADVHQPGGAGLVRLAAKLGPLAKPAERALRRIGPSIAGALPELAQRGAQLVGAVGAALLQILLGLFLMTLAVYYFYLNGPAWLSRAVRLIPLPDQQVRAFFRRFHQVSAGVLLGNLGSAVAQGALATVGYLALSVPVPLLWGCATAFASLVPGVGAALAWAPVALYLGLTVAWWRGVVLALWGALVVSTIDNLIRPLLTRRSLQIHPLLAFVAIFGGLATYGIAGLFLGPLVVALAITVLDLWEGLGEVGPPANAN